MQRSDFSFNDKELKKIVKAKESIRQSKELDYNLLNNTIFTKSIAYVKQYRLKLKEKLNPETIAQNAKPKINCFMRRKKYGEIIRCKSADIRNRSLDGIDTLEGKSN